ncbi:MAG: ArsA-related P-loop ATPase [Myxococcota bacterium]
MPSLMEEIENCEVVLCAGPGGVGKTTTSAAIAVAAARSGKKVLVLTIDPAKRLADALGVSLDNTARRIQPETLEKNGIYAAGEIWALMLDAARTFDDLVQRLAPDRATAERLLNNVIYRHISRSLAGTLEYTAVEKLYDLRDRFDYDLIVVDTPPSKNVLDFVESPEWLSKFFDERILKWFMLLDPKAPAGGFGQVLLKRTGRVVWEVMARVFGHEFLGEITEFMHALESMTVEFKSRADATGQLLRSPASLFFIVATTDRFVLNDAVYLRTEIMRRGISFGGFIINRVHPESGLAQPSLAAAAIRAAGANDPAAERLASKLVQACEEMDIKAREDREAVERLRREANWDGYIAMLPEQPEELHDLVMLDRLAAVLAT